MSDQLQKAAEEKLETALEECWDKNTKATGGGYEADYTDMWDFWKDFKPHIEEYATWRLSQLPPANGLARAIVGDDDPFPLKDVLRILVNAANTLLHKKDYDGPDYEELEICIIRAKEIQKAVSQPQPQQGEGTYKAGYYSSEDIETLIRCCWNNSKARVKGGAYCDNPEPYLWAWHYNWAEEYFKTHGPTAPQPQQGNVDDVWSEESGLSKDEWELEKVVDKVRELGTLEAIKYLERFINNYKFKPQLPREGASPLPERDNKWVKKIKSMIEAIRNEDGDMMSVGSLTTLKMIENALPSPPISGT